MTRICSSLYMLLVLILLTANQGCSQLSNDKGDQENLWSIDVSTANMRKVSSTEKQMLLQLNSDLQSSLQVVSENLGGFEEAFADLIQNGDFKDLPKVKSKDATLPPQCRLRQSKEREGSVALVSKWLADKSATKGTPCTTNYRSEQRTDSISFPGRTLSQMSRRSFVLENPADSDLIRSLSLTETSESFERAQKPKPGN